MAFSLGRKEGTEENLPAKNHLYKIFPCQHLNSSRDCSCTSTSTTVCKTNLIAGYAGLHTWKRTFVFSQVKLVSFPLEDNNLAPEPPNAVPRGAHFCSCFSVCWCSPHVKSVLLRLRGVSCLCIWDPEGLLPQGNNGVFLGSPWRNSHSGKGWGGVT